MSDKYKWIDSRVISTPENEKNYRRINSVYGKILEPIIVVHGYFDSAPIANGTTSDLILNAMKVITTLGYQALLKNTAANDVVALTISQLEDSKNMDLTSVRGAILMDSMGRVGCVSALTALDHPILLSRRLMDENTNVTIVQENMKGRRVSNLQNYSTMDDDSIGYPLNDIRSWSVIARDRREHLAGGRSIWSLENDEISSINPIMSVPGCGLSVDNKSCCSVFGNEGMIYSHAPAMKIIKLLKGVTSSIVIKNKINRFMQHSPDATAGVVYLGANNEPLITSQSLRFPWVYCHRGILKYGYANSDESFSEKCVLDISLNCECQNKPRVR